MSETLKRYDVKVFDVYMERSIDGEYVEYSDYAALKAQADALAEALEDETGIYSRVHPSCQKGLIDRCRCDDCRYERSRAALTAYKGR